MTNRRHFGNVRRLPSGRYQASYWHDGQRHTAPAYLRGEGGRTRIPGNRRNGPRAWCLDQPAGRQPHRLGVRPRVA